MGGQQEDDQTHKEPSVTGSKSAADTDSDSAPETSTDRAVRITARATMWLAILNVPLAVTSIFGSLISYCTLQEIKAGGTLTERAVTASEGLSHAATQSNSLLEKQLTFNESTMTDQLAQTQKQANASVASNQLSANALALQQRALVYPWNARLLSPVVVGKPVVVNISLMNAGKTPGFEFSDYFQSRFIPSGDVDSKEVTDELDADLSSCLKSGTYTHLAIWPTPSGSNTSQGYSTAGLSSPLPADKQLFATDALANGTQTFILTGCYVYKTLSKVHHTGFCYYYKALLTNPDNLSLCRSGNYAD